MTRFAFVILVVSASAPAQDSFIRPGREGRFPLTRLEVVQPQVVHIGMVAGYEVSELRDTRPSAGLGKQMASDARGGVWSRATSRSARAD